MTTIDVKLIMGFTCKLSRMSVRRRKIAIKHRVCKELLKYAGHKVSDQLEIDIANSVKAVLSKTIVTKSVKVRLDVKTET